MLVLSGTEWGQERVRRLVVGQVARTLDGRGRLTLGHLDSGLRGHFVADSLTLVDQRGSVVLAAARAAFDVDMARLLRGEVRLYRLALLRPFLLIEQGRDSSWNISRMFSSGMETVPQRRSALSIALDGAEFRDGHIALVMPDSLPALPPVRREFARLQLSLGRTRLLHPDTAGGETSVLRLATNLDVPPVDVREAVGSVRWWPDSLRLDFPRFRLPASHGTFSGTISWATRGPAQLDLRLSADSVALADIAWISPLIPKRGGGSADVHIRNGRNPHDIEYAISNADLRATESRIAGGFTAVQGRPTAIRDLALELQPLDLNLVREILGDSVPAKVWQGALRGTVRGPGGPLEALVLDDVRLTFADRRSGSAGVTGVVSQLSLAGTFNTKASPIQLNGVEVLLAHLDVRTLGAVAKVADSLHGALTGRLVLDGPLTDLRFHDLALVHVDGDRRRSYVSGQGRLATDQKTRWLDATLSLDTIAVATVTRDRTTIPLRGILTGPLELHATGDTLSIDARLHIGEGRADFLGATLLDSSRTWVRGRATLEALDPRVLIDRRDIPSMRLSGTADVDVDNMPGVTDAHVALSLDTTSVLGDSRIQLAQVRAGIDSTGFHVDTAEVHAAAWRLSARGRLARRGATNDTLRFAFAFDSLQPLRTLLLDSTGGAIADSTRGAAGAAGTLVGSMETFSLVADFGTQELEWNDVRIQRASAHAEIDRLPSAATGVVTLTAESLGTRGFTADRASARAALRDGRSVRLTADASSGDTLTSTVIADLSRDGDTTRVTLDSLAIALGAGRWTLERPAHVSVAPHAITVDSAVLRSSLGATVALSAALPESGEIDGRLRVDALGLHELAFTGIVGPDVDARIRGDARLTGTREAPRLTYTASADSVKLGEQSGPRLALSGSYENRRATLALRGIEGDRDVLTVSAELPVDLALHAVSRRLLADSLHVTLRADSASLAGLDAATPDMQRLSGTFFADVDARGTWTQLTGTGTVRIQDGAFEVASFGTSVRGMALDLAFARDSVVVRRLRLSDSDNPRDTVAVNGVLVRSAGVWRVDLASVAREFNVMDDPRRAVVDASWQLRLRGPLKEPILSGEVTLPSATFFIDPSRRVRPITDESGTGDVDVTFGMPLISALRVTLGSDVRLRSRDANVQLSGVLEVGGELANPYVRGEMVAGRGTYRLDLGVLKRTFRVDSGTVQVAGTFDTPPSIDIWTSYLVRSPERDDVRIGAHVSGTTVEPRLELSSADLGSSASESEIISYLVFGAPSFALDGQGSSTVRSATAALVPSIGGVLEGFFGMLLPFFSSLQVTTVAGSGEQGLVADPLDGLLSSFALTAGRQLGSESYLNLSGGVCRGSHVSSAASAPSWFGVSAEYRPKLRWSAVVSLDPGTSPCNRVGKFTDVYQLGVDVFKDWKF